MLRLISNFFKEIWNLLKSLVQNREVRDTLKKFLWEALVLVSSIAKKIWDEKQREKLKE
jgi:hypothetical protein